MLCQYALPGGEEATLGWGGGGGGGGEGGRELRILCGFNRYIHCYRIETMVDS